MIKIEYTKKIAAIFLKLFVALIGLSVLVAMLWEPHLEGRNAYATLFEIYFKDPFLAYVYISSIPFFVILYQSFKVIDHECGNKILPQNTAKALRIIKYCAFITTILIVAADTYLIISSQTSNDDPAGAIMLSIVAFLIFIAIGTLAAINERRLWKSDIHKSE